jgi:hypothetical protein
MDGRYDTFPGVVEENRNTIGRPDPNRYSGKIRDEGIITFEIFPSHIRPRDYSDPGPMYLMTLDNGIRKDRIPTGGKSFDTRTQWINEKILKHN